MAIMAAERNQGPGRRKPNDAMGDAAIGVAEPGQIARDDEEH